MLITPVGAAGQPRACAGAPPAQSAGTINLRVDNDMFGVRGQDHGCSDGFLLAAFSPGLAGCGDDPCLPRQLDRFLLWL